MTNTDREPYNKVHIAEKYHAQKVSELSQQELEARFLEKYGYPFNKSNTLNSRYGRSLDADGRRKLLEYIVSWDHISTETGITEGDGTMIMHRNGKDAWRKRPFGIHITPFG